MQKHGGISTSGQSIDDVIDNLGAGPSQWYFLFFVGVVGSANGAMKALFGVLAVIIGADWHLSGLQQGLLVSVVYVGQGLGSLVSGYFSDSFGRRPPLIVASALMCIFATASSRALGFTTLLVCRFVLGLAFGIDTSAANTIVAEVCPSAWRLRMNAGIGVLFVVGWLCSLGLVWHEDPQMLDLHWRSLTLFTAVPSLIAFVVSWALLPESPRYLAATRQRSLAVGVLERMREWNNRRDVDVDSWSDNLEPSSLETGGSYAQLFGQQVRWKTIVLCFSTLAINYTYYGGNYALAALLPTRTMRFAPATNLILNAFMEVIGTVLGVSLDRVVSRKQGILLYQGLVAGSTASFAMAMRFVPMHSESTDVTHAMPMLIASMSMYVSQFAFAIGWTFLYVYITEVFPTVWRATGFGFVTAVGRLGSIGAPLAVELLQSHVGPQAHFTVAAIVLTVNAMMVGTLSLETKDRQLSEISREALCLTGPAF